MHMELTKRLQVYREAIAYGWSVDAPAEVSLLQILDAARFVAAPLGFLSLAFARGSPEYPAELRRRQGWASGLDNMWASQYAEYVHIAKLGGARLAAQEDAQLTPGYLGDVPLLVVPAGQTNKSGEPTTCEQAGCAVLSIAKSCGHCMSCLSDTMAATTRIHPRTLQLLTIKP